MMEAGVFVDLLEFHSAKLFHLTQHVPEIILASDELLMILQWRRPRHRVSLVVWIMEVRLVRLLMNILT